MPKLALIFFSRNKGSTATKLRSLEESWRACSMLVSGIKQDEFISAVTGHHIGAPAIRFEDMSDSLQNKVALEVTVKIVDEFEAVEVHQHQCKGASGARGAFPLVAQRFHEKTVRFDALRKGSAGGTPLSPSGRPRQASWTPCS